MQSQKRQIKRLISINFAQEITPIHRIKSGRQNCLPCVNAKCFINLNNNNNNNYIKFNIYAVQQDTQSDFND